MELRHLQYFLMIAREGTISGAAHVLHISQPSLSRQMQDLERELGVKLFDRGSRHIELTEAGIRLRHRAEEIVDLVGRAEAEFHVGPDTLAGEVRIGGGETAAMALVANAAAGLQGDYPLIRFNLYGGSGESVSELLDTGRVDFGVFVGRADLSCYETLPLPAQDGWGTLMRQDDPLAQRDAVRPADIAGAPLILPIRMDRELQDWFDCDPDALRVAASYDLRRSAELLVGQGAGRALCLDGGAGAPPESRLAFRPLDPPLPVSARIAWKRHQRFSPAADAFLQRARMLWG